MSIRLTLSAGFAAAVLSLKAAKELRDVNQVGEIACWAAGVAGGAAAVYYSWRRWRARRLRDKLFPSQKPKRGTVKSESETSTTYSW